MLHLFRPSRKVLNEHSAIKLPSVHKTFCDLISTYDHLFKPQPNISYGSKSNSLMP